MTPAERVELGRAIGAEVPGIVHDICDALHANHPDAGIDEIARIVAGALMGAAAAHLVTLGSDPEELRNAVENMIALARLVQNARREHGEH